MRRRAAAAVGGLGLVLVLTFSSVAAAAPVRTGDRVAGQVVVRFRSDATAEARKAARARASTSVLRALGGSGLQLLSTAAGESVNAAVARLRRDPAVRAASPNFVYRGAATVPNDPSFPQLWGLNNVGQPVQGNTGTPDADIDAPEAWDLTTGDPAAPVAVVDSGMAYRHPELATNLWTNEAEFPGNGIDDEGNGFVDDRRGYDFVDDDADPDDPEGHGTHVAGTIAGRGNNRAGVAGINWRQALIGVRVLDAQNMGTTATVAAGLRYAGDLGARVVSASFTRAGGDPVLDTVVRDHPATLFVFAAGNSGSDNDRAPIWPCGINEGNVICVAATDQHDGLAGFSNFGARTVDLAAPGDAILSTWPGGDLQYLSGTSMAAAHVAGVAALVLAHRPYLPTEDVRDAVLYGGDSIAGLQTTTLTGRRLNARGALLRPEPTQPPAAPGGGAPAGPPGAPGPAGPGRRRAGLSVTCARPYGGRLACFVKPRRLINRVSRVTIRVTRGARTIARRVAYPNRFGRFFLRLPRSLTGRRVRIRLTVELRKVWIDSGLLPEVPRFRTRRWG